MDLAIGQSRRFGFRTARRWFFRTAAFAAGCIVALAIAPWVMPGLRTGRESRPAKRQVWNPPAVVPGPQVRRQVAPAPQQNNQRNNMEAPREPEEVQPEAHKQLAMLENESGRVRLTHDSPVYARPDEESPAVAQVQAGYWLNVVATTPEYLEVLLKTQAVGFVPYSAVHVVHGLEYFDRCFRVGAGAEIITKPNAHSTVVAALSSGSGVTTLGQALADYVYVRTTGGSKGYLKASALSGEVPCPADEGSGK